MRQKDTGSIIATILLPLFLLNASYCQASFSRHVDDVTINFCKVALALKPGTANILSDFAPLSVAAAMDSKIKGQLNVVADPLSSDADREKALEKLLYLPSASQGYLTKEDLLNKIFESIKDLSLTKNGAEKLSAFIKGSGLPDIAIQGRYLRLCQEPRAFKDQDTLKVIQVALMELGLSKGFTPESANYFEDLPIEKRVELVRVTPANDQRAQILSSLRFQIYFEKTMGLLPIAEATPDTSKYAPLSHFIAEELGLKGPLGYLSESTATFLTTSEMQDAVGFSHPLLTVLYKLIRHRLANAITFRDTGKGATDVKLKYPVAIVISAISIYMVNDPILWTDPFKADFLRLTRILAESPETLEAVNFFKTYLPPVNTFLSMSSKDELNAEIGKPLNISTKQFNFNELVLPDKQSQN